MFIWILINDYLKSIIKTSPTRTWINKEKYIFHKGFVSWYWHRDIRNWYIERKKKLKKEIYWNWYFWQTGLLHVWNSPNPNEKLNILSKDFFASIIEREILRFIRNTSHFTFLMLLGRKIIKWMRKQGSGKRAVLPIRR